VKRREFIALVGGAAAAWPLAARAQQGERMRRIGVLVGLAENDPEMKERLAGFRQGPEKLGWSEGGNVRIDYRFAPAGTQALTYFTGGVQQEPCGPTTGRAVHPKCWNASTMSAVVGSPDGICSLRAFRF
jgi:putative ABC transport system substrate-binding protein